jgi:hypothetical protein
MDVALATYLGQPRLDPDDVPLLEALLAEGLSAAPVPWDEPGFDWSKPRVCLLRSTWDYHLRREEFLEWAARISGVSSLWNPLPIVRWNTHKSYLRDLARKGIPVVPTEWVGAAARTDLVQLLSERGWQEAIVKPAISAGAYKTTRARLDSPGPAQALLDELVALGLEAMVQPYLSSVESSGERSVVFIDGQITHAVRKRPILERSGPHWQEADPATLGEEEASLAARVLSATGFSPLYGRVDLARDAGGALALMELELVEPTLFFTHHRPAAERLAHAVAALCR